MDPQVFLACAVIFIGTGAALWLLIMESYSENWLQFAGLATMIMSAPKLVDVLLERNVVSTSGMLYVAGATIFLIGTLQKVLAFQRQQ